MKYVAIPKFFGCNFSNIDMVLCSLSSMVVNLISLSFGQLVTQNNIFEYVNLGFGSCNGHFFTGL